MSAISVAYKRAIGQLRVETCLIPLFRVVPHGRKYATVVAARAPRLPRVQVEGEVSLSECLKTH